jgi:YjbE family integral membrane protein
MDFASLFTPAALAAFGQVVLIDVVLAGDNAIVVGALAAGLPPAQRKQVIMIGIAAALVLRIIFALAVSWLLQMVGLILAGGLLLMWVAWKMWRELRHDGVVAGDLNPGDGGIGVGDASPMKSPKSFAQAAWSVALADVSMSLDNVLAVAGAARDHPGIMVAGLILSVALMGLAANIIAQYIERYRWIAYVGLAVIVWVAIKMIWEGWHEVAPHVAPLFG